MTRHKKALVLNADYSSIGVTRWQNAIKLDFKGLVRVIDFYKNDYVACSNNVKWPTPAVVVLKQYEKAKRRVPYSRKYVYIRDRLVCQYCRNKFHHSKLTLDHVIPRSKRQGIETPTHWENIVTCCHKCNTRKSNYMLEDTDMTLMKQPTKPSAHNMVLGLAPWSILRKEWLPYVPKYYLDLLETE